MAQLLSAGLLIMTFKQSSVLCFTSTTLLGAIICPIAGYKAFSTSWAQIIIWWPEVCIWCRGAVEKKTVLENLDLILLAMDEIVDRGWAPLSCTDFFCVMHVVLQNGIYQYLKYNEGMFSDVSNFTHSRRSIAIESCILHVSWDCPLHAAPINNWMHFTVASSIWMHVCKTGWSWKLMPRL